MPKLAVTVAFEERSDLNRFINHYSIPKEDIIHIDYSWNLGMYDYVLTLYADKSLKEIIPKINQQFQRKRNREYWKASLFFLAITLILLLIALYRSF